MRAIANSSPNQCGSNGHVHTQKRRPMAAFSIGLNSVPGQNVVPPNPSSCFNSDVHRAVIIEVGIVGDA